MIPDTGDAPARIVAQDHTVVTYELNGERKHIVDKKPSVEEEYWTLGKCHKMVNEAIAALGTREWTRVYNHCDLLYDMTAPLESKIDELTY